MYITDFLPSAWLKLRYITRTYSVLILKLFELSFQLDTIFISENVFLLCNWIYSSSSWPYNFISLISLGKVSLLSWYPWTICGCWIPWAPIPDNCDWCYLVVQHVGLGLSIPIQTIPRINYLREGIFRTLTVTSPEVGSLWSQRGMCLFLMPWLNRESEYFMRDIYLSFPFSSCVFCGLLAL